MTDIRQSILNKLRKNKFTMIITLPPILKALDTHSARTNSLVNLDSLQYSVYGGVFPPASIPAVAMPTMGQVYNVTSQYREAYPPITVNFTVDNQLNNYWVLWKWLEVINKPRDSGMDSHFAQFKDMGGSFPTNAPKIRNITEDNPTMVQAQLEKMTNDYTDYQTTMVIYPQNEYNQRVAKVSYYNAFITGLGGIDYSYRNPDEAESSFTFVFNQLDIELLDV